ncbi:uncharacterized protein LOC122616086 isoform X2 [Drosophila teissieri]|uniref:uncharacterized protein LOC122616086 isoform X2 n=1 Tax=Drosophila teissieri TaxID=7243 RepID=UPI001CB9DC37|nr:uncharacterized protein LOC122616086 isoform X2 [Drosophila teissieri]
MLLMPTSCGPGPPTDLGLTSSPTLVPSCPARSRIPRRAADDGEPVRRSGTLTQRQSSGSGSGSAIPQWLLILIGLLAILAQTPGSQVAAEKSKHYYMQSLCKNHFLQQLYRKIDGAVLWSQNERNLDCIITFQTHSVLQRFMLRFDMLQLDCNDHLLVYDGAHAVATPKVSPWIPSPIPPLAAVIMPTWPSAFVECIRIYIRIYSWAIRAAHFY